MAAGLKAHALWVQPLSAGSPLLPRWAEITALQVEILLAVWLLLGWQRPVAWLAAVALFFVLAAISGWLGWIGQSSCGCFGQVAASPWFAFALDLTVLAALFVSWPSKSAWQTNVRWSLWRRTAALVVGAAGLFVASHAVLRHELSSLLADWRGDRLVVVPGEVDVGAAPPGPGQRFSVTLHNRGATPIKIVGGTTDCGCLATSDLPVTVPPGEQRDIQVIFKRSGPPGFFKRGYWLYTDDARQAFVVAWFSGRTLPAVPSAGTATTSVAAPTGSPSRP